MDPLPIENYSGNDFNKFKKEHLDKAKLSKEAIQQIRVLFNLRGMDI